MRTLIHMDDPQHRVVRAIGADWFRPKAMRALKIRVDELAKIYVDKMLAAGSECDFVQEVAVNYPLYVIMSLLGLPEWDFPSATIAGGLHALIENPDQRKRLRDNPDLMPLATEEMIRWVTPVKEFMRTATADTSIRGGADRRGRIGATSPTSPETATKKCSTIRSASTSDAIRTDPWHSAMACTSAWARRWPGWR